jgi:hypothetical protein
VFGPSANPQPNPRPLRYTGSAQLTSSDISRAESPARLWHPTRGEATRGCEFRPLPLRNLPSRQMAPWQDQPLPAPSSAPWNRGVRTRGRAAITPRRRKTSTTLYARPPAFTAQRAMDPTVSRISQDWRQLAYAACAHVGVLMAGCGASSAPTDGGATLEPSIASTDPSGVASPAASGDPGPGLHAYAHCIGRQPCAALPGEGIRLDHSMPRSAARSFGHTCVEYIRMSTYLNPVSNSTPVESLTAGYLGGPRRR